MPIAGTKLNVLNMTTEAFANLDNNKRLVFRLYLNNDDEMTMAFWQGNDTEYDDNNPLDFLHVSGPSDFAWQKDMYFGDQKIGINKVDHIQRRIEANPSAVYVLFIPTIDAELPKQIVFAIKLSDTTNPFDPDKLQQVGVTNPSPPRNSGKRD